MPVEIVVREMILEDLQSVIEIEKEGGLSGWTDAAYLKELELKDSIKLVAEADKKVFGFLVMRLITSSKEAELYNIGVARKYARQGIGGLLLQKAVDFCLLNQIGDVWLEVRQSNENAISFYKKNGFQIAGERVGFYVLPLEDAYLMRLHLLDSDNSRKLKTRKNDGIRT